MRRRGADFSEVGTDSSAAGETGIDYCARVRDGKCKGYDFGLSSYRLLNRTYHTMKWDALNYVPISGYTDSEIPGFGFQMPMDTFKDAKSHDMLDTVCLRFKESDKENRFYKEVYRDWRQTKKDAHEWESLSDLGLMIALANCHVKMNPS